MEKPSFPLVEVEWIDAMSTVGWQSTPVKTPTTVWSAGYLVDKNRQSLVIALCAAPFHAAFAFGDTITIPLGCVKKVRRLR